MPEQQEWWWDKFNESGHAAKMEEEGWHLDVKGINKLLVEHRERIIKELRGEIENKTYATLGEGVNSYFRIGYFSALDTILSLPCLRENE